MRHRNLASGNVGNQGWDEERRRALLAGLNKLLGLIPKRLDAADARAVDDPDAVLLVLRHGLGVEPRVRHGLIGRDERIPAERIDAPGLLGLEVLFRVEAVKLARKRHAEPLRVERLDGGRPALSLHEPIPVRIHWETERRKCSHPGNDNPAWRASHAASESSYSKWTPRQMWCAGPAPTREGQWDAPGGTDVMPPPQRIRSRSRPWQSLRPLRPESSGQTPFRTPWWAQRCRVNRRPDRSWRKRLWLRRTRRRPICRQWSTLLCLRCRWPWLAVSLMVRIVQRNERWVPFRPRLAGTSVVRTMLRPGWRPMCVPECKLGTKPYSRAKLQPGLWRSNVPPPFDASFARKAPIRGPCWACLYKGRLAMKAPLLMLSVVL